MTNPNRVADPIMMVCEGSGSPSHAGVTMGWGICSMCGQHVTASGRDNIATLHTRQDILASPERPESEDRDG